MMRLAAIVAAFNPSQSRNRVACFRRFAAGLRGQGVDLFIAEAVDPDGSPEHTGPNVFHFSAVDTIWHKERLLNLAADRLPDRYDAVAWLDGDLLWDCKDLGDQTLDALERFPVVQLWERAYFLDAADRPLRWNHAGETTTQSMAAHNRWQAVKDADPRYSHPGFAWAARRQVLVDIGGLYDRDMGGGGDTLAAIGWWGDFDAPYFRRLPPVIRDYAQERLGRAYRVINGRVGHLPLTIAHLYHGGLHNRQYWQRVLHLADLGYDPAKHLEELPGELYQWSSVCHDKIRTWLADYLAHGRREDDCIGRPNLLALSPHTELESVYDHG